MTPKPSAATRHMRLLPLAGGAAAGLPAMQCPYPALRPRRASAAAHSRARPLLTRSEQQYARAGTPSAAARRLCPLATAASALRSGRDVSNSRLAACHLGLRRVQAAAPV